MKKGLLSLILLVAISLILIGCKGGGTTTVHSHVDKNNDGICDVCNEQIASSERQFNVQFNLNYTGAPKLEQVKVTQGTTVTRPAEDPTREDYSFKGWYMDSKGNIEFDFTRQINKNTTIYAIWQDIRATISFDLNYETDETISDIEVEIGKNITLPSPVRENYHLDGWYLDRECTIEFDSSNLSVSAITLYAKWTKTEAILTLDLNYEGSTNPTQVIVLGESATRPTNPTRTNFEFDNWYSDKACTTLYDFSTPVNDNMSIYAKWIEVMVGVSFNLGYETDIVIPEQSINFGEKATRPSPDPTRDRYEFVNWYKDNTFTTLFDFNQELNTGVVIYAKWNQLVAIVTFNLNYTGAPTATESRVDINTKVTKADPTRTNYEFMGWYSDEECTNAFNITTTNITGDITLYAKWKLNEYTVTFDLNYTGSTPSTTKVNHGDAVAKPTDPERSGYTFIRWELNNTEYDFSSPVTSNITLKAVFEEIPTTATVTFNLNYTGAPNNGVLETSDIDIGENATKPTDPTRTNYRFFRWCLDADGTQEFDFDTKINRNITLYAHWLQKFIFEAEYIDLSEKGGKGYSCEAQGVSMIDVPANHRKDGNDDNPPSPKVVSNGAWLSFLYYEESTVEFTIYSDFEQDVLASMAITCEFFDMTFNPTIYQFRVNGISQPYQSITINGGDYGFNEERGEFQEVMMSSIIHLEEGENTILLIATNDINHGGTMTADAPMIDYVAVYAYEDSLSWDPHLENYTQFEKEFPGIWVR